MQKKVLLKLHTLCSNLYEQEGKEAVSEDSTVMGLEGNAQVQMLLVSFSGPAQGHEHHTVAIAMKQ